MKIPPGNQTAARCITAFSLVETILAIGLISFAVLAILGLFHVAYQNSLESRRETRSSFLAKQIFGDLRASAYQGGRVLYGSESSLDHLSVNLASSGTYALACDSSTPLRLITPSQYVVGDQSANIDYLVKFSVNPNTGFSNLSRIDLEVSAPAMASLTNRLTYNFVTLIWRNQ